MDNREIKISNGKLRNVNKKRIDKSILIKKGIAAVGAVVTFVTIGIVAKEMNGRKINDIPDGQVRISISEQVDHGETVSEIAGKYYTDDCEGVYNNFANYQREIQENNYLYGDDVQSGRTIQIPVIIDQNNPYYVDVLTLEKQISEFEQSKDYWVRYTVEYGDRLSVLAEKASGSKSETYELLGEIASKNHMDTTDILREGQEIWIINPELGNLKMQLNEARDLLIQSLSNNQVKK